MAKDCEVISQKTSSRFGKIDALALLLLVVSGIQVLYFFLIVHSSRIALFGALAFLSVLVLWFLYRYKSDCVKHAATRVFPVTLSILSICFCLFFPAGTIPDEIYHFKTSYAWSNILSFQDLHTVRSADYEFIKGGALDALISRNHWNVQNQQLELLSSDNQMTQYDALTVNTTESVEVADANLPLAQLKVPSAIGILIARIMGLGAVPMFFMGRLFNMAVSVLLIIFAVRITPIGKNVFMTLSLMPMTLHLLGSYSYDAIIIGLAFLLTSLLLRAINSESGINMRACIAMILVSLLLAPCKIVYYPLVFLSLFIPSSHFASKKNSLLFKTCIILLPIVEIAMLSASTLSSFITGGNSEMSETRGEEISPYYTLSGLISSPRFFFALFVNTIIVNGSEWLFSFVGGSLGWFQAGIRVPVYCEIILLFILALSVLRARDDDAVLKTSVRICGIAIFLVVSFGIVLSMALAWTPNTESVVQGVQGRYFIPVALVALVSIRPKCIQVFSNTAFPILMCMSSVNFVYLAFIACAVLM